MIKYHPKKIKILIAMAEKGCNQTDLSKAAGLNTSTISNFLNGKRTISPASASKIAEALEKNINELFEFEINSSKEEVTSL